MTSMRCPTKPQALPLRDESPEGEGTGSDRSRVHGGLPLTFPHGLPGFPGHRRFHLRRAGGPFFWLSGTETGGPTFLVVDPRVSSPGTDLPLPPGLPALMQARAVEELGILAIVTLPKEPDGAPTMNLQGLVVVNPVRGIARQVVLVDSGLGLRIPLGEGRSEEAA